MVVIECWDFDFEFYIFGYFGKYAIIKRKIWPHKIANSLRYVVTNRVKCQYVFVCINRYLFFAFLK